MPATFPRRQLPVPVRPGATQGKLIPRAFHPLGRPTHRQSLLYRLVMHRIALLLLLSFLVAACGKPDDGAAIAQPSAPPSVAPAITPGSSATGQVVINNITIDYVTVVPAAFAIGDTAPVLLAFPPGGQDLEVTKSVTEGTYQQEALRRGYVVISPAAPDGSLYFQGSEALVPTLVDWIETWVKPEGGLPHLAGISNGGISSFRVAGQNPLMFRSITVFPGFPQSGADKEALASISGIPIRMFVGENDGAWVGEMQATADELENLDADVVFEVVAGEGHIIGSLQDGVRIFDELDKLR